MSVELWTYIIVGLTFAVYLYIGYSNRVRDTKVFYVAGQGVVAIANAAATAAGFGDFFHFDGGLDLFPRF